MRHSLLDNCQLTEHDSGRSDIFVNDTNDMVENKTKSDRNAVSGSIDTITFIQDNRDSDS